MTTANDEAYGSGSLEDVADGLIATSTAPKPSPKPAAAAAAPAPAEAPDDLDDDTAELLQHMDDDAEEAGVPGADEAGYDEATENEDEADDDVDAGRNEELKTYTVKVDGIEVQATLKDLQRAYAGQGYIQKRMEEVAAARKEAENVYNAFTQERAALAQTLTQYQQQMLTVGVPTPPSRELLATDPIGYLEQEVAYRDAVEKRQALQNHQQQLLQFQAEQNAQAHKAYLASQAQELMQRIPDFGTAEKATKIATGLREAGQAYGYSADDLKGVSDARAINVLYDAMRYRELVAKRSRIAEKVEGARPVLKPGAKRTEIGTVQQRGKVKARMQSSGAVDDVAAFLMT